MAQNVYSVNVVGYINLELKTGWNLVANQLDLDGTGANNTVTTLFGNNLPNNTQVFKFASGSWGASELFVGAWVTGGTMAVNPGEGVFINSPSDATVPIVGNVLQGALSTTIPAGYSVVSSKVPQEGLLSTALGYNGAANDQAYFWDKVGQGYNVSALYLGSGAWVPAEPTVKVGESFFVSSTGGTWTRTFNVPQP
jgi:hypothetical protein